MIYQLILTITLAFGKINHHGNNSSLYEKHDPPFLVVCPLHPSRAFTLFSVNDYKRETLPVNLDIVTEEMLNNQIFHSYYRKKDKGVWFEWSRHKDFYISEKATQDNQMFYEDDISNDLANDKMGKIDIIASGNEVHGTRNLRETDMLMVIMPIDDKYFNIMKDDDKCLTVAEYTNDRGAYPMFFRNCDGSAAQSFTFVSVMKTVCLLGIDELCDKKAGRISEAEEIARKRMFLLKP